MTAGEMRDILLKLAHRLIAASWKQMEVHPDRLYLHTIILQQLGLHKDARELLDTETGQFLCARNLSCDYLRREIMKGGGWQTEEGVIAEQRIIEKRSAILQCTEYICHLAASAGIVTGSSLSLFWMPLSYPRHTTNQPNLTSHNAWKRHATSLQKSQRRTVVVIGPPGWV
jgi:hypothetical protein